MVSKIDFDAGTHSSLATSDLDFDFSLEPVFSDDGVDTNNLVAAPDQAFKVTLSDTNSNDPLMRVHFISMADDWAGLWAPEPATLGLLTLGGLLMLRRR